MGTTLVIAAVPNDLLLTWCRCQGDHDRSSRDLLIRRGRDASLTRRSFARWFRWETPKLSLPGLAARTRAGLRRRAYRRAVILCSNLDGDGYEEILALAWAVAPAVRMVFSDGREVQLIPPPKPTPAPIRVRSRRRIGIDCRYFVPWRAGIGEYVAHLVPRLVRRLPEAEFILYQYPQRGAPASGPRVRIVTVTEPRLELAGERRFYDRVAADRLDLFHATGPLGPPWRFCPTVLTIHDVSVRRHPECFPAATVRYFRLMTRPVLATADLILTDSVAIRDELAATYAIPNAKLLAVPLAPTVIPPRRRGPALDGLRPGYLLYLGTIEPRKNLEQLIAALLPLWRSGKVTVPLVLAGRRGWQQEKLLAKIARFPWVNWLGYVPARDLPALLANARALVYLSRYEGFGLPVANAMACGVPVVTTPGGALGEVAGDAAALVEPDDRVKLRAVLLRLLNDDAYHRDLVGRGRQRVRQWSWDEHAARVAGVYRRLLAESTP